MFEDLIKMAIEQESKTIAIACPEHEEIISMIIEARNLSLCKFVLFGNEIKIKTLFKTLNKKLPNDLIIIDCIDDNIAACNAVNFVSMNKADILMKGFIDTKVILKKVLNSEYGLRTNSILSHVMVCNLPKFNRLLFLTDGAMNINPSITDLKSICDNAAKLAISLGVVRPKIALLSAVEKFNPKITSTVIATDLLSLYNKDNYYDIHGPLALDCALDHHAAKIKGLTDPVSGNADILVGTYIEVINVLYKGWAFGFNGMESGGIVLGAKAPIVLVSRADSIQSKINSLALSILSLNGVIK